MAIKDGV